MDSGGRLVAQRLTDRVWRVTVGELDISALAIDFQIMRSIKREPNTLSLSVFNLSADHRAQVQTGTNQITVRAGYRDTGAHVLFVGDARNVLSEQDKTEIKTTIEGRDSGRAYQQARIDRSYAPGTPVATVVRDLVARLGVGEGNTEDAISAGLTLRNDASDFGDGYTASGKVPDVLTALLRGSGYRWSIQNNAIQILRRGRPIQSQAVRLSKTSGLIGSPAKGDRGRILAMSLIQPGLDPGRRIVLDTPEVSGGYEVERAEYVGTTRANDWSVSLTLRPL